MELKINNCRISETGITKSEGVKSERSFNPTLHFRCDPPGRKNSTPICGYAKIEMDAGNGGKKHLGCSARGESDEKKFCRINSDTDETTCLINKDLDNAAQKITERIKENLS